MKLTYIYHSGFAIEAEGFALLIDYYRDSAHPASEGYVHRELLTRAGTLYILSSHFHPDHFSKEVLGWKSEKKDIRYIFSRDILQHGRARADDALFLRKGETYEDSRVRIKAFGSTDVGVSFRIETEGKVIFHAGDLNNWIWLDESTPEEVRQMEGSYLRELETLAQETPRIDLALFPVDPRMGTDFMRGARQFVDRMHPAIFVPMHFWCRPQEVAPFGDYATAQGTRFVLLAEPGESLDF